MMGNLGLSNSGWTMKYQPSLRFLSFSIEDDIISHGAVPFDCGHVVVGDTSASAPQYSSIV